MANNRGRGIVKAVLSGDTMLVMGLGGASGLAPAPERQINLASLMAPRIGNRDRRDEPYAWASREFLRRKVIGKPIYFRIDYSRNGRDFATVWLLPEGNAQTITPESGENINQAVVENGWCKVQRMRQGPEVSASPDYEELVKAEQMAEQEKRGLWNKDADSLSSVRDVHYDDYDAHSLLDELKGRRLHAVIEQVRDGSTLRALLLPSFHMVTVHLAGIQAPTFKLPGDPGTEGAELAPEQPGRAGEVRVALPFANEAKAFTEARVLHRDVGINLHGADKNNKFFGTLQYGEGANLAEELAGLGLAKVVEWSAKLLPNVDTLRAAEKSAKDKKLRLWKEFVAPSAPQPRPGAGAAAAVPSSIRDFTGKVVEVASGDTIVVLDGSAEKRVTLADIRAPRITGRKDMKDEPYGWEAKEFLRSALIGKKVHVVTEYMRTIPASGEREQPIELACATVTLEGGKNVGEALLEAGLGRLQKRRPTDEDRSVHYEALLAAENNAIRAQKGMHKPGAPPTHHVNDLSSPESRERAKQMLPFLQRKGTLRAVVQYVTNGHRFKLYVPAETCFISFILGGIRCPAVGRRDGSSKSEPFADEALAFSRQLAMQHDAEIEIEGQDRLGSFIGSMSVAKKNVAVALLEEGLAKVDTRARVERSEFARAQEAARRDRKRLWTLPQEEESAAAEEPAGNGSGPAEELQVEVADVVDGGRLFLRPADSSIKWIEQQLAALAVRAAPAPSPLDAASAFREGEVVAAKFSADDQWYRARVDKALKDGDSRRYRVTFVDYGNTDVVPADRVRALDAQLAAVAPQAFECVLAGVRAPAVDEDYGADAAEVLKGLVWERRLKARVVHREGKRLAYAVLLDEAKGIDINATLIRQGLARVQRPSRETPPMPKELLDALREQEDEAKRTRANMWQYGDIGSDDEDRPGMGRGAPRGGRAGPAGRAPAGRK
eukprot:tig00021357_g20794.t1